MFQTKPTPAQLADDASAKRCGDLLLAMETQPALGFRITPLAVRVLGEKAPRPVVGVRLGDTRHSLTPDEARLIARCVQWDYGTRRAGLLASLFDSAAADAEAMADHGLLVADGGCAREVA